MSEMPTQRGRMEKRNADEDENRLVEVHFKRDEERQSDFRGFARAQETFDVLVTHGALQFPAARVTR